MVKYGLVSVGVLVEPEGSPVDEAHQKNLILGLQYRVDMADFIITVSDHDNNINNSVTNNEEEGVVADSNHAESSENLELVEKYGTLQRIFDSDEDVYGALEGDDDERANCRSTIRNRPSCRKTRSESKMQCYGNSSRAYITGLNHHQQHHHPSSSTAYKSCDYYRQKFFDEGINSGSSDWLNYSTIQKTAGQKVVNKLAAQQKALEAEEQRKKSLMGSNNPSPNSDSENRNLCGSPQSYQNLIPLKKKTVRLDPIPFHQLPNT